MVEFNHDQGALHWCLTLDGLGSYSGTYTPAVGETRYDAYQRIRSAVLEEAGRADGLVPVTLFFDLQPNVLAVPVVA